MLKTYRCGICNTKPDQISHHKMHMDTQKHKDKRDLFELKVERMSEMDRLNEYGICEVDQIVKSKETMIDDKKQKMYKMEKAILEDQDGEESDHSYKMDKMISNREALRDKIHEIHNFMRNNGAGYGMNALKLFSLFYGLKKIEDEKLFEKSGLPESCKFSSIVDMAKKGDDEKVFEVIDGNVLDLISRNEKVKNILFHEIPRNMRSSSLSTLIKEIDSLSEIENSTNYQLSGKIYEYFIGRNKDDIHDLGAYFTDRHIVNFIYEKLNPQVKEDGTIYEMIDMFGGSGGFTTGYINYLNKSSTQVNWETELEKVHHYDMNEDVIKIAGLEFFCLTHVLPKFGGIGKHMGYKNSFSDKFISESGDEKKFHYIITNPPYGGDTKKSRMQERGEKIKKYIIEKLESTILGYKHSGSIKTIKTRASSVKKYNETASDEEKAQISKFFTQLETISTEEKKRESEEKKYKVSLDSCSKRIRDYAEKYGLTGNDKESVSLIQMMELLDVGGTAVGVLKEGVFFDRTYKDIRKCLIENFNLREVISIPQGQFENTSTKTSIIIFDNSEEKTSVVRFSELIVEKYMEDKFEMVDGYVELVENQGDIANVHDVLVSEATVDELLKNENVSLNGKEYNKKELLVSEEYELVKLGDICEFGKKSKRQASFGQSTGMYNFYTSSDKVQKCDVADYNNESIIIGTGGNSSIHFGTNFSCSADNIIIKTEKCDMKYLFNVIKSQWHRFTGNMTGSTIKHVSKNMIEHFKIPVPKSEAKMKEWVKKISAPYDEKIAKEAKIKSLEAYVRDRIEEISEKEECEEVELGKICEFKSGNFSTCNMDNKGVYPFYNATINPIGYHSDYSFDDDKYILLVKSGNVKAKGIGSVIKVYGKNACVSDIVQIKTSASIDYLYYTLQNMKDIIRMTSSNSVGLGHLRMSDVKKIKIKIPKNRDLIKALEPTFAEIEALQSDVKRADAQYKAYIQELSQDAILGEKKIEAPTQPSVVLNEKEKKSVKKAHTQPSVVSNEKSEGTKKKIVRKKSVKKEELLEVPTQLSLVSNEKEKKKIVRKKVVKKIE